MAAAESDFTFLGRWQKGGGDTGRRKFWLTLNTRMGRGCKFTVSHQGQTGKTS